MEPEITEQLEATFPILRFFAFEHLPERLQPIARDMRHLAFSMAERSLSNRRPGNLPAHAAAETVAGLRKLLEAKDCFVRASLP